MKKKEVVVSSGKLMEIGCSFRVSDMMNKAMQSLFKSALQTKLMKMR